jgi:DNA-binding NtrC family response regulator
MPFLFAFRDDRLGFRFEVGERAIMGRSPECELIIFDRAVSRQHIEIAAEDDHYVIKDLSSSNGTFLNGVKLQEPKVLKRNDEIRLGEEVFLFDPLVEVALGKEGMILMVGGVDEHPEGLIETSDEPKLGALNRASMAALYKVATALARAPNILTVMRQTLYVLDRLFQASRAVILWPEGADRDRLTALTVHPPHQRVIIPRPLIDRVCVKKMSVAWPKVITALDFANGERTLEEKPQQCLAAPLLIKGEPSGLVYLESEKSDYEEKELNLLSALATLISPAIENVRLIGTLSHRAGQKEMTASQTINFIGEHPQVKALQAIAAQEAVQDSRILIEGEAGTGKELMARLIHTLSSRKRHLFLSVNCSSFSESEIRRGLFGQEAGSIDEEEWSGFLEEAEGGTVFIHNINHLPLSVQEDFLKAIEEGMIYRVGSTRPHPVNFRPIVSSPKGLKSMVEAGDFREDLYQRVSEITLTTYPLRELGDDVILLAKYFLGEGARLKGLPIPELDPAAAECLRAYNWPGNSGELKNVIERIMIFHQNNRIIPEDLPLELRLATEAFKARAGERSSESVIEVEKDLIRKALSQADGDLKSAAGILGLAVQELRDIIYRHDISMEQTVEMQIT